jgi:hypothetical protein
MLVCVEAKSETNHHPRQHLEWSLPVIEKENS